MTNIFKSRPLAALKSSAAAFKTPAASFKSFLTDESGLSTIEVVLILVVLIGLVIVFKTQINALLNNIFSAINSQASSVYGK